MRGRERYPVNVRYPRELRNDVEKLRRVLVPVMTANPPVAASTAGMSGSAGPLQIPLGELADIKIVKGATAIKSEEGLLTAYVFIDYSGGDVGGYVDQARKKVASLKIPEGYRLSWSGEYEYIVKTLRKAENGHSPHALYHFYPALLQYEISSSKRPSFCLPFPFLLSVPSGFSIFSITT